MSDHTRWADSAGAYVLGAMGDDERREYEQHLAGCTRCREEVEELRPAAEALPLASPPKRPSVALKDRVMTEVERESELLRAAGPEADRVAAQAAAPRRRRRSLFGGWRLAPAAAALLAAGLLAGVAISGLTGDGARTYDVAVDRRQAPEATAELRVDDGEATLVADGLPTPPEGRVYQVWVKRPGADPEPTSALFLPSRDGSAAAAVPGAPPDMEAVLVTHEPAGGSRAPTRPPLLTAPIS
jgi:anti-sigma-K factor RskA